MEALLARQAGHAPAARLSFAIGRDEDEAFAGGDGHEARIGFLLGGRRAEAVEVEDERCGYRRRSHCREVEPVRPLRAVDGEGAELDRPRPGVGCGVGG
ncbi:MAG: hypothetical protein RMK15_10665, partial [Chloroflexota bacterium]|nr:hypothetical protein [Chloroflexota bacterium]